LDKVWLWIIGFAGHVILLIQKGYRMLVDAFPNNKQTGNNDPASVLFPAVENNKKASLQDIEARLLRIENHLKMM